MSWRDFESITVFQSWHYECPDIFIISNSFLLTIPINLRTWRRANFENYYLKQLFHIRYNVDKEKEREEEKLYSNQYDYYYSNEIFI